VWVFRTDISAVSNSTLNQFIGLVFVVLNAHIVGCQLLPKMKLEVKRHYMRLAIRNQPVENVKFGTDMTHDMMVCRMKEK